MCVVSMISDHYLDKWRPLVPQPTDTPSVPLPWPPTTPYTPPQPSPITPAEIDEFRRLLERAREYDRRTNQKDCENKDKVDLLKRIAKELGVDLPFLDGGDEEDRG